MSFGRAAGIVAMVALALAFGSPHALAQDRSAALEGEPRVAAALFEEAHAAADLGDWERASACLSEAEAQDLRESRGIAVDADIRYLSALASVKLGHPLPEALGELDEALASGRFSHYSKRDASVLKAELLVRERRWKAALDALGPEGPGTVADGPFHVIRARALAGLGDTAALTAELSSSLQRFPEEPEFARIFLSSVGSIPASAQARELGELVLGRLDRYALVDPELPVLAAPLMVGIEAERDAVRAYRASGGSSPAATLRALEYGLVDETAAVSELLSTGKPVALRDLSALFALAGSPAGRAAELSALLAWSGSVEVDADGDGIAEASFSLDKGNVTGWRRDSGQAGLVDERADFADGLPSSVELERVGLGIKVTYAVYPAVYSIAFKDKGEARTYSFSPESLAFAPLAMRAFAGSGKEALYFPDRGGESDPSERSCAAVALNVAVEKGSGRIVTVLDKGIAVSSTAYEDGRALSTMAYSKGRPTFERVDSDGDGRFETERQYSADSDGAIKLAAVRVDADGDGFFEYREQTVFPFRKEWDFDGNGSIDAVQLQLADGSIEQEFSSRLDGRLDEAVIVKAGKIVSLKRDGVALALVPDSNPSLTWIGRKGFDLGRNLPSGEGIFIDMNSRYRLTRIGDLAFAELVP